MSGTIEAVGVIAGSGVVGAVTGYLTARRKAKAAETIASRIHDERVAPALMERLGQLETRIDARDSAIQTLRVQAAECEAGRVECKRELEELSEQLEKVTSEQRMIRHSIRAGTPPGSWSPGELDSGEGDAAEG